MLPVFGSSPNGEQVESFKKSPQFRDGKFVNRIPDVLEKMRKEAFSVSTIMEWLAKGEGRVPATSLPEVKPDLNEFLKPCQDVKVIWFGHSTFLLNFSGKIILVDPVFSGSASPVSFMVQRFQAPVLKLEELPKIDLILISHDHYDHLDMETMKFFAKKENKFLTPLGVGSHLVGWGIDRSRITELDWWQSTNFEGIEFVATPAQHFSGRGVSDGNKTLWASWVIRNSDHNIYFSGDSGYDTHFKEIGDKYGPFDIAFIENGQYNQKWRAVHALPEESVQAYFDLRAKRFFPIHWGMFVLALHSWREPVDELLKLSKSRGVNLVTPKIGETVAINDNYRNVEWWTDLK
ncbi:MBL fold metallo-hydrolase [Bdellovibrio sp. HCB-162]|uniref:MBL fold metallo-hydrolase n=1 Tax=Bdellovibrio sp. HCB-162 TaxID=3394234 RepID=UPI0039BCEFEC